MLHSQNHLLDGLRLPHKGFPTPGRAISFLPQPRQHPQCSTPPSFQGPPPASHLAEFQVWFSQCPHLPPPTSLWVLATLILFDHKQLNSVSASRNDVTLFRALCSHSTVIPLYCICLFTQLPPTLTSEGARAQRGLGPICSPGYPDGKEEKEKMDKGWARCWVRHCAHPKNWSASSEAPTFLEDVPYKVLMFDSHQNVVQIMLLLMGEGILKTESGKPSYKKVCVCACVYMCIGNGNHWCFYHRRRVRMKKVLKGIASSGT